MHVTYPGGKFIDREEELGVLERSWESRPALVVVYGRRRVGKTRLVLEWLRSRCRGRKYSYYHAVPARHEVNLSSLAFTLEKHLGIKGLSRVSFHSIDSMLELVAQYVDEAILVIDEFTYWARAEPRVVGELQRFVDHVLPDTRMVVVLAGSLVGVMHRGILGGGAPLYGRASYRIKLGELRLRDIRVMHADMKLEDVFLAYSVFGGIPFYHVLLREYRDVAEALWDLFLSQAARLRDEVGFMLREEFREPSTYYSVLRAVALGADSPSRIAEITGMHRQHVGKYLAVLEELGLVGREVPVFSKKGRYVIKDKLLMTWFNIVEPIAMRDPSPSRDGVLPEIKEKMHLQASRVFEEVARRFAVAWGRMQGARFDTVGRFVHKGVEIDVIGIINDRKEIHLFEAKWSDLDFTEARRIITGLERRAAYLPQSLADYTIFPHVIARECTGCEALKEDNAFVHSLDEVVELT